MEEEKRARRAAYYRDYLQRDGNMKKHNESCKKWRKERMTKETKEKIRQYQREYYLKRKAERDKNAVNQDN